MKKKSKMSAAELLPNMLSLLDLLLHCNLQRIYLLCDIYGIDQLGCVMRKRSDADSEGPEQTAHARSLIWAFAIRKQNNRI